MFSFSGSASTLPGISQPIAISSGRDHGHRSHVTSFTKNNTCCKVIKVSLIGSHCNNHLTRVKYVMQTAHYWTSSG